MNVELFLLLLLMCCVQSLMSQAQQNCHHVVNPLRLKISELKTGLNILPKIVNFSSINIGSNGSIFSPLQHRKGIKNMWRFLHLTRDMVSFHSLLYRGAPTRGGQQPGGATTRGDRGASIRLIGHQGGT